MDEPDRRRGAGTLVFACVLLLGLYFGFECFQARRDATETHALVQRLEKENATLRTERSRYEHLNDALARKNPEAIRRALQEHGWVPPGRVVVLEEGR